MTIALKLAVVEILLIEHEVKLIHILSGKNRQPASGPVSCWRLLVCGSYAESSLRRLTSLGRSRRADVPSQPSAPRRGADHGHRGGRSLSPSTSGDSGYYAPAATLSHSCRVFRRQDALASLPEDDSAWNRSGLPIDRDVRIVSQPGSFASSWSVSSTGSSTRSPHADCSAVGTDPVDLGEDVTEVAADLKASPVVGWTRPSSRDGRKPEDEFVRKK